MRHRTLSILGLLGLVLLNPLGRRSPGGEGPRRPDEPPPSKLPGPVEQVLWWLPVDTQTLVVVQGPTKFLEALGGDRGEDGPIVGSWLPSMAHEGKPAPLAGTTVKLLVGGSRRFRAPKDLGPMRYEGATITVFEHDIDDRTARSLHEAATQSETIAGWRVSLFKFRMEQDDWTTYIAQPKPNILISATHRGYLADLLGRMEQHAGDRAFPDNLAEWKSIDPTARLWGMRHYDRKDAELDPTSPSGPWGMRDDQAVGLIFAYHPSKREAIVRHLSKSKEAGQIFSKFWYGKTPEVRAIGPDLVEASATLKLDQVDAAEGNVFFRLLVALGHGVCL